MAVNDALRADAAGTGAYSYEKLLSAAVAAAPDLDAARALVEGNYDDASFLTFSKIPSQFLADGRLRQVWTILANIGAGWALIPVDTLLRAAQLAQESA